MDETTTDPSAVNRLQEVNISASFIFSASFQEMTRVLTEAAISGKVELRSTVRKLLDASARPLERWSSIQLVFAGNGVQIAHLADDEPQRLLWHRMRESGNSPSRTGGS